MGLQLIVILSSGSTLEGVKPVAIKRLGDFFFFFFLPRCRERLKVEERRRTMYVPVLSTRAKLGHKKAIK